MKVGIHYPSSRDPTVQAGQDFRVVSLGGKGANVFFVREQRRFW